MSGFHVLPGAGIEAALTVNPRQYLVGDLARPQELANPTVGATEIGIVDYAEVSLEPPHFHPENGEFIYVLAGRILMWDLEADVVHTLNAGDFLAMAPGHPHAQKSAAGTRLLFVKSPGGNDKTLLELTPEILAWQRDAVV